LDDEFDSVERAKAVLREQQEAQRAEVGRLAAAAASAFAALSAAQDKEVQLGKRLDRLSERQSDMLLKELSDMEELDALSESEAQVAVSSGSQSMDQFVFSDSFSWSQLLSPPEEPGAVLSRYSSSIFLLVSCPDRASANHNFLRSDILVSCEGDQSSCGAFLVRDC
jgi:DNA-binding transcriptional LysR family regulator